MNFNFKVVPTTLFDYNPTDLLIQVKGRQFVKDENNEDVEMLRVDTELTQFLSNGKIIEIKTHFLPLSVLSAFSQFNTTTLQPDIDPSALGLILSQFNLALDNS